MAIDPAIGVGLAPGRFAVDAAQTLGNDTFFFLLFMPNRPLGFGHHLVGADNFFTAQVQETVEK